MDAHDGAKTQGSLHTELPLADVLRPYGGSTQFHPAVPHFNDVLFRFREDVVADGAAISVELDIGQVRLGLAEEESGLIEPLF